MTEWMQANSIWVALGLTILVAAYFIIAIVQVLRKKPSATGPVGIILLSVGLLLAIFLIFRADELEITSLAQMILTIGLLLITAAYAGSAEKQAVASVKMAEEMTEQNKTLKETVSVSIRPSISINLTRTEGGTTYPFEPPVALSFRLQNKGKGTANNLIMTCEKQNKELEYSIIELPYLNVGDERGFSIRRITDVSAQEIRVAYVILEVLYNDDLGEDWHVTLEVYKDDKSWKAGETTCERL